MHLQSLKDNTLVRLKQKQALKKKIMVQLLGFEKLFSQLCFQLKIYKKHPKYLKKTHLYSHTNL
jgi:hypothetical protein